MSDEFDPYYRWLGIPPKDQPPDHYRLLSIERFEPDADVIAEAADRQMAHLRTRQSGSHAAHAAKLLNEIAAARVCLLSPQKRAQYDAQLARPSTPTPITPVENHARRWQMIAAGIVFVLVGSGLLYVVARPASDRPTTDSVATGPMPVSQGEQKIVSPVHTTNDQPDAATFTPSATETPSHVTGPERSNPKPATTGQTATTSTPWRRVGPSQRKVSAEDKPTPDEAQPQVATSAEQPGNEPKPATSPLPEENVTATLPIAKLEPPATITDDTPANETPSDSSVTTLAQGKEVSRFVVGKDPIIEFALSVDGGRLATCGADNRLTVIDLKAGTEIQTLSGADLTVQQLALMPDGRFLLASGLVSDTENAQVRTYRVAAGVELTSLPSPAGKISALAISPGGLLYALGHSQGLVTLHATQAALPPAKLYARQRTADVTTVLFSADNQQLVFGDSAGQLHVVFVGGRKPNVLQHVNAHAAPIHSLGVSARGDVLLSAATDGSIALWHDWQGRSDAESALNFNTGQSPSLCAALAPSGKLVASGTATGEITLWNAASGQAVAKLSGHTAAVVGLAFLPASDQLASASRDGTVRVWTTSAP